ncbi:MAG TPA: glycosyltransferase family 4 protein [Longimicrobiales bacterium]
MRILMFNYEYPPVGGGGGVAHALIAEELAKRHDVYVITSAFPGLPAFETTPGGVRIHRVPVFGRTDRAAASLVSLISYPPMAWVHGARLLRTRAFHVVNAHFAVPTGVGSLPPARRARVPHVLTLHGGDIYDPSKRTSPHRLPGVRAAVTTVLRRSDVVVAQSTNTRDNAYRYYGYRGPIEIIPLGIRVPRVPPQSRAELGLPEDGFLAVTVGRLVRRKAVDRLLGVLARPECAETSLVVVGSGPELDALRNLATRLGIASRVHFTGWVDDVRKWQILHAADAYVSSTLHEGFGLVYLEAMAAGLPVIAPDHGGQVDFLRDRETGFVTPAGNDASLAAALAMLRHDREGARRIGRANRERFESYRIERCAAAYERVFERLAARGTDLAPA